MRSRASEASESCPEHHLEKPSTDKETVERLESVCEEDRPRPLEEMTPANSLEDLDDEDILKNLPELSHFSEEGIADMDIPDDILDELEYLDILHDNITSCDGVRLSFTLSEINSRWLLYVPSHLLDVRPCLIQLNLIL